MSGLPQGWVDAPLGDVIELRYGKSLPEKDRVPGGFGVYGSNGLVGSHISAVTDAPAIVVGRKGSIGEVHFSETACFPIDTTYFVDRFDCTEPRFALHLLGHLPLRVMNRASAIPGLNREDAYGLPIALPPLPEQRRIVAKIDNLTGKSRRARDHLDHIPRLVEKYKQAVLAAAFRGDLTDSKGADLAPLGDFIRALDQGWSPKCEPEPAASGEWAVIKTTAIQPVEFIAGENKRLPPHLSPRPEIAIQAGDVLITRAGPRSRVAISCVVVEDHPRLMLCDKAYRLRVDQQRADPAYLTYMLNSPQCLGALEVMKTGISDSGLNLTQGKFLELPLPAFSKDAQVKIVDKVRIALTWIDRLTSEATSARSLIDRLDQAVLAKAFRGELVPQDPEDEPASVLLARIRAELGAAPKAKRTRRAG